MDVVIQKIAVTEEDPFTKAVKYYTILSSLNDLFLTEMEINLLAFTAVRGTISSGGAKRVYVEKFSSSISSIGNYIHKLSKKGLMVRANGKIVVHPQIAIDFTRPLMLQIKINGKSKVS